MERIDVKLSADNEWLDAIKDINHGKWTRPRGLETLEKINHTTMCDMRYPVITNKKRELGYRFMVAEAHWILTGNNKLSTIKPFSKNIARFSDDGYFFRGAYGPKIVDQLQYVCRILNDDINTRQAVINIWRESPYDTDDVPCTISFQFIIRENKLNVIANMRSNDLWLGWPYDNFNFSMLGAYVALLMWDIYRMDLDLGVTVINAGSRHLYQSDHDKALECVKAGENDFYDYRPLNIKDFRNSMGTSANNLLDHLAYCTEGWKADSDFLHEFFEI
jgi:thymidylate synthase